MKEDTIIYGELIGLFILLSCELKFVSLNSWEYETSQSKFVLLLHLFLKIIGIYTLFF